MTERLNSDRISIYSLNKFLKWQFLTVIFNIGIPPCIFLTKVCGNRALGRSISAIFPTAFAHSVSLCHILVILAIFQTLCQQKYYNLLKVWVMVSVF